MFRVLPAHDMSTAKTIDGKVQVDPSSCVTFRTNEGELTAWTTKWDQPELIPEAVSLEIEFTEDVYIQWPLLTASVRVDPSALNDLAADMLGERDLDKSIKDLIGKRKQKP